VATDRNEDGRDPRRQEMQAFTNSKRIVVSTALVAGALTVAAPVAAAQSSSPDVVERAVESKLAEQHPFQASPDAIDRAVAARQTTLATSFRGSPDAIERAVAAARSLPTFQGSPDAIDRHLARANASFPPDAFERALITNTSARTTSLAAPVVHSSDVPTSSGVDWSDFGLGAGIGLGSALLLTGLGLGVLMLRRGQRMTTA
jgi:hypothetical protein